MITADFCKMMARYNAWQNGSIYTAAGTLSDEERRVDRGSFFGSIHQTLSHLTWGDTIWMSRFDGWDAPKVGIPGSGEWMPDWTEMAAYRTDADARIVSWATSLSDARLSGDLTWYSGALEREVSRPLALCVTHFFNHQTHHRGQVHAMLTAAGARPDDTDLFVMPNDA